MKKLMLVICAVLILTSTTMSRVNARYSPSQSFQKPNHSTLAGDTPWLLEEIEGESGNNAGTYPSVTFSDGGTAYISYRNSSLGDLWLASPKTPGEGNCGEKDDWYCRSVDTTGDVGAYSSIDYWKSGVIIGRWKLGISYFDTTNQALKAAIYTCTGIGPCNWAVGTIKSSGLAGISYGAGTALKFNADGVPSIAYYYSNAFGNDALQYAYQVSSGGSCGEGDFAGLWECTTVDSGNLVGKYPSIDFTWDGQVFMSYYDQGNGALKVAWYGGIGTCGTANAWICNPVDQVGGVDAGLYTSLSAKKFANDPYRIAYYDATNGHLKIAYTVNSGGNCATSGWQCDMVDDMGTSISPMGVSLAVGDDGIPIIAYQKFTSELSPGTLHIARPAYALGLSWGNCGDVPPGYLFLYWQCDAIDNAGAYTSVAAYAATALAPNGLALIAYTEEDTYDSFLRLKVAYQVWNQVFLPITLKP